MLFTIAVILLVLWLLGLVSGYTMGNFIYVLLVIALVLFVVGLVSGRRRSDAAPSEGPLCHGGAPRFRRGSQRVGRWPTRWPPRRRRLSEFL